MNHQDILKKAASQALRRERRKQGRSNCCHCGKPAEKFGNKRMGVTLEIKAFLPSGGNAILQTWHEVESVGYVCVKCSEEFGRIINEFCKEEYK